MKSFNMRFIRFLLLVFTISGFIGGISYFSTFITSAGAVQQFQSEPISSSAVLTAVGQVAFSPDGKRFATVGENNEIIVRDSLTGQSVWVEFDESNDLVTSLAYSPDGKKIVNGGNAVINIWDADSGQKDMTLTLDNSVASPVKLALNGNNTRLAMADQNHNLLLWNIQAESPVFSLLNKGEQIDDLSFSPDSQTLISTRNGKSFKIEMWEGFAGKSKRILEFNSKVIKTVFSQDGSLFTGATQNGKIIFWDPLSGAVKKTINTQTILTSIAFSPDNKSFAISSGGVNPQIQFWNLAINHPVFVRQVGNGSIVNRVVFNADGTQLASVDEDFRVTVWQVPNGNILQSLVGHTERINQAIFVLGQPAFITSGNDGQIIVWDLTAGKQLHAFQTSTPSSTGIVSSLTAAFQAVSGSSPTSNTPVSTSTEVTTIPSSESLKANAVATPLIKKRSIKNWQGVAALSISKDGSKMAAAGQNGSIRVFLKNGTQRWRLTGHHSKSIAGIGFRDQAKQWVSVGRDTEIRVWDDNTGKQLKLLFGPEHPPRALAVSPDEKWIAVAGEDTRILVFDAESRALSKVLSGHSDFVNGLTFSPNSKSLASAGVEGRVFLWDIVTGKKTGALLGHADEVNVAVYNNNGSLLASGSRDSSVIIWNTLTGERVKTLRGHQSGVRSLAFNPAGNRLISGGEDSKILVWNAGTGSLERQISTVGAAINTIAFSPDGNLHVGDEDSKIHEFKVDTGEEIGTPLILPETPETSSAIDAIGNKNFISSASRQTRPSAKQVALSLSKRKQSANPTNAENFGLADIAGRVLDWIIPSAKADPNVGPGGPILVITTSNDPFGKYYAEIMRTEGFNSFAVADISTVTATALAGYDVVILAKMALSAEQVTMLSDWVTAGGNLIAMRPDSQLNTLLGINASGTPLTNGYLLFNTGSIPGNGLVNQTIQYHGAADRYTPGSAATLATLYSNATTATSNPAVTLNSVGANGGQAAAFAFDLASSIVYTRQGNPAWATQERDGFSPIRSDDKFYGAASTDVQPDWVDLNKVAIPQADEQQRFLANLILVMNGDKKPLPRFWYFPKGKKAVVVMTGDDHANNGTQGRFDQFKASSAPGCSVIDWECIRGTSYIFPNASLTNAEAVGYQADGFEIGLHVNTDCADFTPQTLRTFYTQQIANFVSTYPGVPAPLTQRHHCIAWSDWVTGAIVQLENGIRFDTSYYFWPPGWVQDRPGFFTGSGMPMRFVNLDGSMLDVYHAASQMTDESGQSYPFTIDSLLNRALGPEGYYGAFVINAHTDVATIPQSDAVLASAPPKGVPIVSSKQMLDWLDGRNASSFGSIIWTGGNTLTFNISVGTGARNMKAMLPANSTAGVLLSLNYIPPGGSATAVNFDFETIKGLGYAFFNANAGSYTATYGPDITPPEVIAKSPSDGSINVGIGSVITSTFDEAIDANTVNSSTVELKDAGNNVVNATVTYNAATRTLTLDPIASLSGAVAYTVTVKGGSTDPRVKDLTGIALAANVSWSFTTEAQPCAGSPCSIWPNSTVPTNPAANDSGAVELGVKFRSSVDGFVTGVRFYKGLANTGTHVGNLWSTSGGVPLATATFTNETASGWQQVTFATPVPILANTTYIASYFAPNGNYAATNSPEFGSQGVDTPPLQLLMNGVDGGNGVYAYGSSSTFPQNSYNATNYWVDVVFTTVSTPDNAPPTVVGKSPSAGATGVGQNISVTATFNEALNTATINNTSNTFELRDASNALVAAAVSYDQATRTATLTPASPLTLSGVYTATIKGGAADPRVKDLAGNALVGDETWSFTITDTMAQGCSGATSSIWPATATPGLVSDSDISAVELGVKFRPNVNGYVCGIRFYKGSANTGIHVGNLWPISGGLLPLATATFTNETASGWQQVNFSSPVAVTSGQTYVASYHAPAGRYSADANGLATDVTNTQGNLTALASGTSGGNGVYAYGSGGFPTQTFQASNYWVDVAFTTSLGPDTFPPAVSSTNPGNGAVGIVPTVAVKVIFTEPMDPLTISTANLELRDSLNNLIDSTLTYNSALNTATLTPNAALAESTVFTVKVIGGANGVKDVAGNALESDYTASFTTGVDPCSAGGHPIVCENSKAGNPASEWDVSGAGDLSIQGFATDISVNRGQTVRFKIDTSASNYRLDIYRMGYYSGMGARKVATVQPSAFPNQPACLSNSTGLIDCGNWLESASWSIPADATSGIYFAKAIRLVNGVETGGGSHIFFIVRNDASTSEILFQTADTTWQAYNNYGGNSLYGGSGPGGGLSGSGRAYKVSYNRPFNTRAVDGGQDWVFNAEYPMVRWLEANGYNVSYFSGIDSDRFGNLIGQHKLFMSNAHDEYWSGAQRANVEAARDRNPNPVNLAFFSGNEVFWKTRWENSIDTSNTPYRTMVCYKETHEGAKIDPLPSVWTGTWRDPRFSPPADGGRPENALIGTIFTVNDGATTRITVPEADGKMRFWRNTAIANLTVGNSQTLPFGTLGYEWDEDLDNGFRPAGLMRLSTTIVPGAPVLTDYGSSFGSGVANHALTLYKAQSGSIVFGAGTVQWAWGLDANHDRGGAATDINMQQATVNLLADMGIQPATLQANLQTAAASNDTVAPASTIQSPGDTVPTGSLVVINGAASDDDGRVGGIEVSVDNGLTWHRANGRTSWTYPWNTPLTSGQVTIKSRAVDDSLNLETPGVGITVNVGTGIDNTPPTDPANLQAVQASGTAVNLTWTASTDPGGAIAGYRVERCAGPGCTTFIEIASRNSASYGDAGLTEATSYSYRVRAVDTGDNFSNYTSVVSITPDATPPVAPGSLAVSSTTSTNVNLTWNAPTDNVAVTGYELQRCIGAGCTNFAQISTPSITSYSDTGLSSGVVYQYRVRARDAVGNFGDFSNVVSATTATASVPTAVADLFLIRSGLERTVNYAGPLGLGVLANDTEPNNSPLTASAVGTLPTGVTLTENGVLTVNRTSNTNLRYRASNGTALSLPTTGTAVAIRLDTLPLANVENCTYVRSGSGSITSGTACVMTATPRQFTMNLTGNDTDGNATTNIPTDGLGDTIVFARISSTATGVPVSANPACGQAAIVKTLSRAAITNNCDGTITVNVVASAPASPITVNYWAVDDLGAQSSARNDTVTVQ